MTVGAGIRKICVVCGSDVASKKRVKDTAGNYYCRSCWDARIAERREQTSAEAEAPASTKTNRWQFVLIALVGGICVAIAVGISNLYTSTHKLPSGDPADPRTPAPSFAQAAPDPAPAPSEPAPSPQPVAAAAAPVPVQPVQQVESWTPITPRDVEVADNCGIYVEYDKFKNVTFVKTQLGPEGLAMEPSGSGGYAMEITATQYGWGYHVKWSYGFVGQQIASRPATVQMIVQFDYGDKAWYKFREVKIGDPVILLVDGKRSSATIADRSGDVVVANVDVDLAKAICHARATEFQVGNQNLMFSPKQIETLKTFLQQVGTPP